MDSRNIRLDRLTDENAIDVERLLYQYRNKICLPALSRKERETRDIVGSLRKAAFCRVLVADGDVFGALVAKKSVWDSAHFGFGVGKITRVVVSDVLEGQDVLRAREVLIKSCLRWMKQNKVKCVIARIDLDSVDDVLAFGRNGFLVADVLATFHLDAQAVRPASDSQAGESVTTRLSCSDDVAALMDIARTSFTKDHFHRDHFFPQGKSDELFAKWVYNSCNGLADIVLVAVEDSAEPCGFIACRTEEVGPESKYGVIDLVAVSPSRQGMGIGTRLVKEAATWFACKQNVHSIFVGTQANNIPSIRTYGKAGFRLLYTELTLHRWFLR